MHDREGILENAEERNNRNNGLLITGNENALNLANMAHAIDIQQGSSATVEELGTLDRLSTVAQLWSVVTLSL